MSAGNEFRFYENKKGHQAPKALVLKKKQAIRRIASRAEGEAWCQGVRHKIQEFLFMKQKRTPGAQSPCVKKKTSDPKDRQSSRRRGVISGDPLGISKGSFRDL
jgi:hypothetical protein